MKERLLKIIKHYGVMPQLKYIHSEYFELDEAILNYENYENLVDIEKDTKNQLKDHIAEEIADVIIMLSQIQVYYNIKDEDLKPIMFYKINRQIERIEKENDK